MKSLYAPWRTTYAQHDERSNKDGPLENDCPFCQQMKTEDDARYFILKRCTYVYVVFNKFPYNSGHLLIIPYEHVDSLDKLSKEARIECMELANASILIVQDFLKTHGFNVGINMGKAAGAGLPSHLHMHLLPRWYGDTSFLPTISDTKAVSIDLHQLYAQLRPLFQKIIL